MEGRAVADTRRHGDDRLVRQSADDARERAFHAGDNDDDVGRLDVRPVGEEPVDARYVVVHLDHVAIEVRCEARFLRHGDVARAGRQDEDHVRCVASGRPLDVEDT